jgi:uncharacterized protein (TIGR03086 family)
MDIPAMFDRAVAEFDARVRQIGDHQWQAATPDEDWCVRDLVNHLVGEDLWAPPLLAGSTIAEVGDRFEGDVLGSDPEAAWTAASAEAVRAVEAGGAMDRIVHLSFGDFPSPARRAAWMKLRSSSGRSRPGGVARMAASMASSATSSDSGACRPPRRT